MADLDDVGQKIKGKFQQLSGDLKSKSRNEPEGKWDKFKGNVNETIADFKLKNDKTDEV